MALGATRGHENRPLGAYDSAAPGDAVAEILSGGRTPLFKLVRPAEMDPGMVLRAREAIYCFETPALVCAERTRR